MRERERFRGEKKVRTEGEEESSYEFSSTEGENDDAQGDFSSSTVIKSQGVR